MSYQHKWRGHVLAAVASVTILSATGCEDTTLSMSESSARELAGTLGLALQLAPDVTLTTIDYQITGVGGYSSTGTLQVPGSSNVFSASIGGIPVGQGYQLKLTARAEGDAGLACAGSAVFDVLASATTQVNVALLCDSLDTSGSASINGSFNVCPSVTSTTLTPLVQVVGSTIALGLSGRDVDHGPSALAYTWTTTSGTLAQGATANPTLLCASPGLVTLHYEMSDGSCSKEGTLSATCVAPATLDAGMDSGTAQDAGALDTGVPADGGVAARSVVINEVESSGGSPDDWIELYNTSSQAVDISGWGFRDNDDTHPLYKIASGTIVGPGAFYVLDTLTATTPAGFNFGLGSADSTRLYAPDGSTLLDTYSWTAHASSTYGRCPNGAGAFVQTTTSKGSANLCPVASDGGADAGAVASADAGSDAGGDLVWPGPSAVLEVDAPNAFASNLSGLSYQAGLTLASSVLWGVQNGPSMLYRLHDNGTLFVSSTDNGWSAGKQLFYPNGMGGPDSEGVVFVPGDSADVASLYVSTERDNTLNTVSRLSVLQFDANAPSTSLKALREWNLTGDLPVVGPNLGLEGITFVSDAELAAQSFREGNGQPYNQTRFSQHGGGIFLVGVEGTGTIHAYALNHADGSFAKLASFSSGMPAVMDLAYDPDTNYLWAYGDDSQGNRAVLFEIEANMA
ncbi:MAG: hypothetical protein JWN04_3019, partial [Myxococcaceae bacterium]|nr:hypothetical protein [Myxococcaceae bacterium]